LLQSTGHDARPRHLLHDPAQRSTKHAKRVGTARRCLWRSSRRPTQPFLPVAGMQSVRARTHQTPASPRV
jgi:hypothetical protein